MEKEWEGIVKGDYEKIDEKELYFETIPVSKVIWLSILTCGIYEVVWFYKIWKRLDEKFGYKNTPLFRAIFASITSFWLFPVLSRYIKNFNVKSFNAVLFAILYFVLFISCKFPGVLWLISITTFVVIAVIQNKINKVNEQNFPEAPVNKWCGINTLWSVIGGILLCLGVLGTFIPDIDNQQQKPQLDPQQIQQQIEQMKEYSFKNVSLLSHIPFERMSEGENQNREMYIADSDDGINIFVEETVLTKDDVLTIKIGEINARNILSAFIYATESEAEAKKAMETAEVTKIGDIEQASYEYEPEGMNNRIKVFVKDNKYVIVLIFLHKDRTDLEPLASKISESIKLSM